MRESATVVRIFLPLRFLFLDSSFLCAWHPQARRNSNPCKKRKNSKTGVIGMTAIIKGKIMNLSVEAKVAIAVATGFLVVIVGAMAQG